jgi:hypothetical protein
MAWTKVKTAIVVSASVLLVVGTATVAVTQVATNLPQKNEKTESYHWQVEAWPYPRL